MQILYGINFHRSVMCSKLLQGSYLLLLSLIDFICTGCTQTHCSPWLSAEIILLSFSKFTLNTSKTFVFENFWLNKHAEENCLTNKCMYNCTENVVILCHDLN